jgi:uncharacterized membrane protein YhhN
METLMLYLFIIPLILGITANILIYSPGNETKPFLWVKTMTTLSICALALFSFYYTDNRILSGGIALALLFGAGGDFLLSYREDFFTPALISFLLGHLFYLITFFIIANSFHVIAFLIVFAVSSLHYGFLARFVGKEFKIPIVVYFVVISLMVVSAFSLLGTNLSLMQKAILPAASILFYLSDSILAYDKFVRKIAGADYIILIIYYAAQILFGVSLYV